VVACVGALLSELSGLAGVGLLMGVPAPGPRCPFIRAALISWPIRVRICRSTRELRSPSAHSSSSFLLVAWRANPDIGALASGAADICLARSEISLPCRRQYRRGDHAVDGVLPAVSVVEKKLTLADLPAASARLDTLRCRGDPNHHGRRAGCDRGHARKSTQSGSPRHRAADCPGDHALISRNAASPALRSRLSGRGRCRRPSWSAWTAARTLSEVLGTKHFAENTNRTKRPGLRQSTRDF